MTEQYTPISCALYDVLEAAAVRRARLVVLLTDGAEVPCRVADLRTRGAEEFCILKTEGGDMTVRLDRIAEVRDPVEQKSYRSNRC